MKILNVKVLDWTHKALKILAAVREKTIAEVIDGIVEAEAIRNPEILKFEETKKKK